MTDLMTDRTTSPVFHIDPIPTTPAVAEPEPAIDEDTIKLLTSLGFDHVPTIEEAREALAARRAKVREEVLFQADRRGWCEDGTRKVCADLRLQRPGYRTEREIRTRVTLDIVSTAITWTERGALHFACANGYLPILGTDAMAQFNGGRAENVEIHEVRVDGQRIELTNELKGEITNA